MKSKLFFRIVCFFLFVFTALILPAAAVEPNMADYTAYPVFMAQTAKPNILVILDNSGSMNYAAYGTWAGDGGTITEGVYTGTTPYCGEVNIRVIQSRDDSEEDTDYGGNWYNNSDLDLGSFEGGGGDALTGIRFQRVSIPRGSTITSAYIRFTAHDNHSDATSLTIRSQLHEDATQFSATNYNISGRTNTTASVAWDAIAAWTADTTYDTPDLAAIVQEIVDQATWESGNAMVFKISGTGKRDAKAYDNSSSQAPFLHVEYTPASCTRYYGYFDPDAQYAYSSGVFVRSTTGQWNGNLLNWLCMRRIDVARKVMVGGLATSRTGGGNTTLIGDSHTAQSGRYFQKWFDSSLSSGVSLTPYNGNYCYGIRDGYIYVGESPADADPYTGYHARYVIKVKKEESAEPEDFFENNISGVMQRVADKARFGLEFYNDSEGGNVKSYVAGGNITNIVTNIENEKAQTWTPLAEAVYEGVRYFRQDAPYYFNGDYTTNATWDAYYWNDLHAYVPCGKSFILLITDGESTEDLNIPVDYHDYDADSRDPGTYASNGSDYLDDVALWAHVNDMRTDLEGDQVITLYTVFAFGAGSQLLQDAAKNGGFIDRNGNKQPDQTGEYDANSDGFPDTYFESEDGYELERKIMAAITDILKRTAAGSAVSVLATSGEGDGNLVQAYFKPVESEESGVTDVKWTGYLQSLWVDLYGYLREDTDGDLSLDVTKDKVIKYFFDAGSGSARIKRFDVSGTTPYPDIENDSYETVDVDEIMPLWEGGKNLAARDADDRKIFTYLDKDKDSVADEPATADDPFDDQGEVVQFAVSGVSDIKPYLGVANYTYWKYLGNTHDARAYNLIEYIRGKESGFTGTSTLKVRTRTIDNEVWKLGDIVNSSPIAIAKPPDNYHLIYADTSYFDYWWAQRERETMIYVGANDGMLHAFTSWYYDRSGTTGQFIRPDGSLAPEVIGDELWAYIPQSLLPHLKWLASDSYTHVYYVDLQPKIFDAKIFIPDSKHVNGWGTILVCGLNMGGKYIWSEDSFDDGSGTWTSEKRNFNPSYFAMDITDPRNPRLLWERTYTDLKMTTCIPAVAKVKEKWYLIFGSGPETYEGTSTVKGHIYIADLLTGDSEPHPTSFASGVTNAWRFETGESKAFMGSACTLDMDLNYSVDAAYLGESYYASNAWKGKLYKVAVPWDSWGTDDTSTYHDDPFDWKCSVLFDADRPITAAPSISLDFDENIWVYFGSGRYISESDKYDSDTQYLFGVKDPFFNEDYDGTYYHSYASSLTLDIDDLFDADDYLVYQGGVTVYDGAGYFGTWEDLLADARAEEGWSRTLDTTRERVVRKPTILGGIVLAPSFIPNSDICSFGGESNLYGLYYETGTAYYEPVFKNGVLSSGIVLDKIGLGVGSASALGIHVGREIGARAYIQQSTGTIVEEEIKPAFDIKSNLRSWKEKWN